MHAHPVAIASISLSAGDDAFENARKEGETPEDVVNRAHREPALFNSFIERAVAGVVGGASVLFTVKNTGAEPGEHAEDVALGRLLANNIPLEGLVFFVSRKMCAVCEATLHGHAVLHGVLNRTIHCTVPGVEEPTLPSQYALCEHGIHRFDCRVCAPESFCEHDILKTRCRTCGGGSFCEHDIRRTLCRACGGGSLCQHDIGLNNTTPFHIASALSKKK